MPNYKVLAARFVDMIKRYGLAIEGVLYCSTGWYLQQPKLRHSPFQADKQLAAISIAVGIAVSE